MPKKYYHKKWAVLQCKPNKDKEDMNAADDTTELTSSGVQWAAVFFVLEV